METWQIIILVIYLILLLILLCVDVYVLIEMFKDRF